MEFIPAPNCASVEMIFTQDTQRIENVYHVHDSTPYDLVKLGTLAGWFVDWWLTNLQDTVPPTISLVAVVCKALDSETSPAVEYTTGLPALGTGTAYTALPNNVSVAVKWSTGLRGRSYRGRTFHIGLAQEYVVGNTLNDTPHGIFTAAYYELIGQPFGMPGTLVVLSKFHDNAPRVEAVHTEIINVGIDKTVDSMRKRLPGRGR